jgi:hypothetical protein
MINYNWQFECIDNGRKRQVFTISAPDKATAINKGFARARKKLKGDIVNWDCKLILIF